MRLVDADEQDLKILGGLPELRFLRLHVSSSLSATIHNITDSDDACYFPKLRCLTVYWSIVLFVAANKGNKKSISFHIWKGEDDIGVGREKMPIVSDDDELERPTVSAPSDGDELQGPIKPTVSDDDELQGPLQRGIAAIVYYLLAFLHFVLAFLKIQPLQKLGHHTCISGRASAPALNGEDPIDMPSVSDGDDQRKGSAAPRFMPSLQVLRIEGCDLAMEHPRYLDNLGWEYLPSLQEINMRVLNDILSGENKVVADALSRAAQVHPNRPRFYLRNR